MITLAHAISKLYPNADWVLEGLEYSGLQWKSTDILKPTQSELETEQASLQAEYEAKEYQRLRAPEYPPLSDLADAMYWASKGDNTKLDNYYAACEAVKLKYPKS